MGHGIDADLATLCQACGMCCDGSLFGRVPLGPEEIAPARRNRLLVLENGKSFEQPCSALSERERAAQREALSDRAEAERGALTGPSGRSRPGNARHCSIYEERPLACRTFVCRLYDRHRREGGPLAPRLAAVRRVRELVAQLQATGVSAGDFDAEAGSPSRPGARSAAMYAELQERLKDDFGRA